MNQLDLIMSVSLACVRYADLGGVPWYVLVFLSAILSALVEMEVESERDVVVFDEADKVGKGTRQNGNCH